MTIRKPHAIRGAIAAAVLVLPGCGQLGSPANLLERPPAPDEFQVIARKPLRMPASLNLPEPRLGEPSPLEPDPNADAVAALYGPVTPVETAALTENSTQTDTITQTNLGAQESALPPAEPSGPSAGERSLLAATNASAEQTEIRRVLEEDLATGKSNEAYEPPTVGELLGLADAPPKDSLEPAAEARRLQIEGIAPAPIDPNDQGDVVRRQEDAEDSDGEYPITRTQGQPRTGPVQSRNQVPAFE